MAKAGMTVLLGTILALVATAIAQSPPSAQTGMGAQQAQPTMPGQATQPAGRGQQSQPAAPGQTTQTPAPEAQNAPSGPASANSADGVARQLAQLLNLNEAQTGQIKTVFQAEQNQLYALRDDPKLSAQEKQAKLMDIRKAASDKIMAILTPEQQKKLAEEIQKRQQQQAPVTGQQPHPPQ